MGAMSDIEECLVVIVELKKLTACPRELTPKIWFDNFASDLLVPAHYVTIESGIGLSIGSKRKSICEPSMKEGGCCTVDFILKTQLQL
jgi:hypothetical protein